MNSSCLPRWYATLVWFLMLSRSLISCSERPLSLSAAIAMRLASTTETVRLPPSRSSTVHRYRSAARFIIFLASLFIPFASYLALPCLQLVAPECQSRAAPVVRYLRQAVADGLLRASEQQGGIVYVEHVLCREQRQGFNPPESYVQLFFHPGTVFRGSVSCQRRVR